jgi:hydroxyethylthiazole kinase
MPAEGEEMRNPDTATRSELPQIAATLLERLRTQRPAVHCITNAVAQNFTANFLLAAGCVPSMTLSAEEIGAFVGRAQALLVNLGTFDAERREATEIAVRVASGKVPWVLDPVFIDRSPARAEFARALMARGPRAVRLNRAEFSVLAGGDPNPDAVAAYAREKKTVVGLSGATDFIADGKRSAQIANGHPLMAKVTAMGCAASSLVAACFAVEADAFKATAAALLIMGVAGEVAATEAKGPGSFAVALIDALHNLDGATLAARVRVN